MNEPADSAAPEGLRNIRLLIAYDGTNFSGWQKQKSPPPPPRTVQAVIEEALEKIHKRPVRLTGAGRTDAGVHASGQAANFYTGIASMAADRFVPALNSLLPRDVRILEAQEAGSGFHARFDARMRTYRYHWICGRQALPTESPYALQLWRHPRLGLLNSYARLLRGEMDCSAFASPREKSASRSRYFRGASFFVQGDTLVFEISANAFMWKMVRTIAGTMLRLEEKGFPPEAFQSLMEKGDYRLSGPALPPEGLFLWKVEYE